MIKNNKIRISFSISLLIAILTHLVILFFVKKSTPSFSILNKATQSTQTSNKINQIKIISHDDLEKLKQVGIKNGVKKNYFQPDQLKIPRPPPPLPKNPGLSFNNLSDVSKVLPPPKEFKETKKMKSPVPKIEIKKNADSKNMVENKISSSVTSDEGGHFNFNPKKQKIIPRAQEQDNLKEEAFKNIPTSSSNRLSQKLSNFEIRYERPEGVSEDELNSDEKAYYSFFKRSYASYLNKLYANYERISVERPRLEKDFENKHLLIGRIDYDEKGNIILVKILKSSESDDIHYFFEETLKQLNLPNPPKSFIKNKKQFSTYYQIQIN